MRENRTCGSEGGEGVSPSRPLSVRPPAGIGFAIGAERTTESL